MRNTNNRGKIALLGSNTSLGQSESTKSISVRQLIWLKYFAVLMLLLALHGFSFGQTTYYSRQNGNWAANATWSTVACGGAAASSYPVAGDNVIICTHTITLTANAACTNLSIQGGLLRKDNNGTGRTLTVSNDLTMTGGDFILTRTGVITATIGGDFSINNGTLTFSNANNTSATMNIAGNFSQTGGTITETGGGTARGNIIFNGNTTQTFTKSSGTISQTINFTVNSGATLDMGTSVLDGSAGAFTLSNGATLITAHPEGISSAGALGSIRTTTRTFNSGANLVYNGTVAQVTGSFITTPTASTINSLTINNSSGVNLSGNLTVAGTLTLSAGRLKINGYSLNITSTSTSAIQGTFSNDVMIETDGAGYLTRVASTVGSILFPIGSNNYYSPVTISAISGGTAGEIGVRTQTNTDLGSKYLQRIWDAYASVAGKTLTVTFAYDAAETSIVPDNILVKPASGNWQYPTGARSFGTNEFTVTNTDNITTSVSTWTAGLLPNTYFSYQEDGSWNNINTWTTDPGGTTLVGSKVPEAGDVVVILPNRKVYLPADISTTDLEININGGGILDMGNYRFTSDLAALKGTGTLMLSSANFPSSIVNTFILAGGGTTEYYNASDFTFAQQTYNNLTVNLTTGVVATQLSNITLNGNLLVKRGTYRIGNDVSTTKRELTIQGNVTVNAGAFITVGKGSTNTTAVSTGITGGTAPFLNYYEHFHRVVINGNFTNNGSVRFTNLSYPVYNAFPPLGSGATSGAASVYFQGEANSTLLCNGTTDFYNLILDKGNDQTYSLVIQPSVYSNFRIFGANNAATTIGVPDPDLMKALWIRNGTLVLKGHVVIPSLTEGTIANSEYYIPYSGALVLDGPDVTVLNTADNYGEVNVAYSVSGGTGEVNGVNVTGAAYQGLVVYGKLTVNDGYLSTRESAGLLYSHISSGQIEINSGVVDAKQFRTYTGTASGAAYRQNGGTFILRGRFVRPVSYATIADLKSTTATYSLRAVNGTDHSYGTFNLQFDDNIFSMSGGTIRLYDASGTNGIQKIIDVESTLANTSVTGGTIEVLPQTGTGLADFTKLEIYSKEAVLGNLIINRGPGCATYVRLRDRPLTILQNFTITSGDFRTNGENITIGGNLTISNDGIYNANANTTFNGSRKQLFTIDGTINNGAPGLSNLVIDRSTDSLKLAGSQSQLIVQGNFDLNGGVFADGGKTVSVAGNITNSGTHTGIGKIQLNGTLVQTIGGNGSGVFQNIEFNNSNAANAPITLLANMRINGESTFTTDKQVSIGTYSLTLGTNASVTNAGTGTYRYFATTGAAGDGGITKEYASTNAFQFPLGVNNFTPASIGFASAPSIYGSITVKPVNYQHPNVTATGRSLTYFWRVQQTGFNLSGAQVNHSYTYSQTNVVTGGDVTEDGYVAALYNPTTFTWTRGTAADVDETTNVISFNAISTIEGEYTAGDDNATNPFGTPRIFYSCINGANSGSGLWGTAANWSLTSNSVYSNPSSLVPGINDIVIIGGKDSIYLATNNTVANTGSRSCATLQIEIGSALDIGYNPSSNFRMVIGHPGGNGNFRLTTSSTDRSSFVFPNGDFSDYNVSKGTTEFYTVNPNSNTYFILPSNANTYGTVILSPLQQSNIVFPNISSVTFFGDLITRGTNWESWFGVTWLTTAGYPAIVPKTITIRGDLLLEKGSLVYIGNNAIQQTVIVEGDVVVYPSSGIDVYAGGGQNSYANILSIAGNLINNSNNTPAPSGGHAGSNARFYVSNLRKIDLVFTGNSNSFITNTGTTPATGSNPTTILGNVIVNKGSSQATTLTLNIGGTLTTLADNWLTLQNGTFKYIRTNPSTDFTISQNTPFTIPSTAGFHVEYTTDANRRIIIADTDNAAQGNNSDVFLEGKLTVVSGSVIIGTGTRNNDIEYAGSGDSHIDISGGSLVVNGQIRRNPAMSGGILKYTQSGGTVTINGRSATLTNAKFEVANVGSVFDMSGGALRFIRGGGSSFGDIYIRPHTSTVTGGTIEIQPTAGISAAEEFFTIDASVPLYNLTITGAAAADAARVSISTNPLVLKGTLTLSNGNSYLTSNNFDITVGGDFTNNGLPANYVYGTNTTIFNGGVQQLNGSSATHFNNLTVNPITSLSLANGNNVNVNGNLTISRGTLICGSYAVNLKGDILNDARYTDSGYGVILNGTVNQSVSGNGDFARLELNNAYGATTLSDITISKNLVLTNGVFDIKNNKLSLGATSIVEGTGFGTTKMIITDGVFSAKGISKVIPSGASTFTYPLGVTGKYTPVELTVRSNGTIATIRINNVNSHHPAVIDPDNVLQYYWAAETSELTGFDASLLFRYLEADVRGTLENQYQAAQMEASDIVWKFFDSVDEGANTINFDIGSTTNFTGEFTAGVQTAFPGNVPVFTTVKDGIWNDPTVWQRTAGDDYTLTSGPNGFIVIINHEVATDANYCQSYRTTINGKLKVIRPFFGHNFGTVTGAGTLYLEQGLFPAGKFTSFLSCSNNSTLEYGGTTDYNIIADLYSEVSNLVFTGSGQRRLPNKVLTICKKLDINGPTLDNSLNNTKLIIKDQMLLTSGAFNSGTGSTATVEFAGTTPQSIQSFNGTNKFNNLQINNAQGLTLTSTIEVGEKLILTNGKITSTATNILYISNPLIDCVTPTGGSSTSYVSGPLKKKMDPGLGFFRFPVGNASTAGNMLSLRATQVGTLDWTVEYINPSDLTTYSSPLSAINETEYWNVTTPPGGDAIVGISWNPSSNLTPLMTELGTSDMRVSEHNGTDWIEIASTVVSGSNSYNGTVETSDRRNVPALTTRKYTLGCINTPKPRIRLAPTGPVCGNSGIPIVLSSSYTIYPTFTINYTENGTPKSYNPPSFVGAMLPTNVGGATYILTGFTYQRPSGGSVYSGAVDVTPVITYAVPTTATAGIDQSPCGATTALLLANEPTGSETGLWTIVTGAGGSVAEPTIHNSSFSGISGNAYVLRWTISIGACTSSDDVEISFPLLPAQPLNFIASPTPVCQGTQDVVYTVPNDPLISTYNWTYSGTGASFSSTTNSVEIDFDIAAQIGLQTVSVTAKNGCGTSAARIVNVIINPTSTAAVTGISLSETCEEDDVVLTFNIDSKVAASLPNPSFSFVLRITNPDATFTDATIASTDLHFVSGTTYTYTLNPLWINQVGATIPGRAQYQYSISSFSDGTTCLPVLSGSQNIFIWKRPETGPQYHVPNTYGF